MRLCDFINYVLLPEKTKNMKIALFAAVEEEVLNIKDRVNS